MVTVALSPVDAVGHLAPMLAVCRALIRHPRVSAVCGFGQARLAPLFRQQGAEFEATTLEDRDASRGDLAWKSFVQPLENIDVSMHRMIEYAPDVILSDPFSLYGVLAAHLCSVPSASLVTMAGYGTLGDEFVRKYPWEGSDILTANASYAQKFAFDFCREGMMPVLFPSRDLSLIAATDKMTVEIDPDTQPLLHRMFHWMEGRTVSIGPCLSTGKTASDVITAVAPREAPADDAPFPFDRLERAKRQGKRIILFSFGTVITGFRYETPVGGAPTGHAFLRRSLEIVAEAVGQEPDLLLVAAVGSRFARDADIDWPDDTIVRAVLPQRQLLESYADAFITHHGASSQAESILAGVPMISLPGAGDQIANARLAVRIQAAVAFWDLCDPFSTCDVGTMRKAINFALNDKRPRRACAVLAADMKRHNGAETAAQLIVSLAERKSNAFPERKIVASRRGFHA